MGGRYNIFLIFALLLSTSSLFAGDFENWDKPWDNFVGCYKTLKYKGRNVSGDTDNITLVETDVSDFFKSTRGSSFLPILKVITYRGNRGNHPYGYYQAFLDRGQFVKVQEGFNYYVDTLLRYGSSQSNYRKVSYESTISFESIGDLVEFKVVIRSDVRSDMFLNQSGTYLLKPITCP